MVSRSQGSWILAIAALYGNPFDGHRLKDILQQVKKPTGAKPPHA
jgi:IS5 family transposase